VLAVVTGRSAAELRAARRLLDGALERTTAELRRRLIDLLAELEAGIDFVDEGIEFVAPQQVRAEIDGIDADLAGLLAGRRSSASLDARPRVLLIGRPNVGKSSLLNALAGRPRAIVSPVAGTTRDPVTAVAVAGGFEVVLIDSAGVSDDAASPGSPEAEARAATARRRAQADLSLLVFDAAAGWTDADRAIHAACDPATTLTVANKIDLPPSGAAAAPEAAVRVSAQTGAGLDHLRRAIADGLEAAVDDAGEAGVGLNARHRQALTAAREALGRAGIAAGQRSAAADLIALELREAAWHLGAAAGQVVADDVLDRIFARFCVGK
jgi:tRNA modification GTPase